jgi:hypothetical protein
LMTQDTTCHLCELEVVSFNYILISNRNLKSSRALENNGVG